MKTLIRLTEHEVCVALNEYLLDHHGEEVGYGTKRVTGWITDYVPVSNNMNIIVDLGVIATKSATDAPQT